MKLTPEEKHQTATLALDALQEKEAHQSIAIWKDHRPPQVIEGAHHVVDQLQSHQEILSESSVYMAIGAQIDQMELQGKAPCMTQPPPPQVGQHGRESAPHMATPSPPSMPYVEESKSEATYSHSATVSERESKQTARAHTPRAGTRQKAPQQNIWDRLHTNTPRQPSASSRAEPSRVSTPWASHHGHTSTPRQRASSGGVRQTPKASTAVLRAAADAGQTLQGMGMKAGSKGSNYKPPAQEQDQSHSRSVT